MTDIALALNTAGDGADLIISNGDIALDDTLTTAVLLSLLCNRAADPADGLPRGADTGGWWGDAYLPQLPDGTPDAYGSKLWLRQRLTATQANANLLVNDLLTCLAWMKSTGVASDISAAGVWVSATALSIGLVIAQNVPGGAVAARQYNLMWDTTLGLSIG